MFGMADTIAVDFAEVLVFFIDLLSLSQLRLRHGLFAQ